MWSQGVLPEWMFPKDIRIIVSVKDWPHGRGKWLELVDPENKITDEILSELVKFDAPIKYTREGKEYIHGSPEFKKFYQHYAKKKKN
jgi:hypothetical protein